MEVSGQPEFGQLFTLLAVAKSLMTLFRCPFNRCGPIPCGVVCRLDRNVNRFLTLVRQTLIDLPRPTVVPQPVAVEIQTPTLLYRERVVVFLRKIMVTLASILMLFMSVFLQSGGLFAWMNGWLYQYYAWILLYLALLSLVWLVKRHFNISSWHPVVNLAIMDGVPGDPSPISIRSVSEISSEESFQKVDAERESANSGSSGLFSMKSYEFVSPAHTDVSV